MQNNLEKMLESMENRWGLHVTETTEWTWRSESKGSSVGGMGYVRTPSLAMPQ